MIKYVWIVFLLLCYLSFAWSVIGVFKLRESKLGLHYRFLQFASLSFWIVSAYILFLGQFGPSIAGIGLALSIFSLSIFWWARMTIAGKEPPLVFSKIQPRVLITEGPFRYVPHPFYLCYSTLYIGHAILLSSYILLFLALGLVALYMYAAVEEDRELMGSELSTQYQNYKKRFSYFYFRK